MALVAVANGRFFGGGMMIAPDAALDDGLFDIVILRAAGKLGLIQDMRLLYGGRHRNHPAITILRGKKFGRAARRRARQCRAGRHRRRVAGTDTGDVRDDAGRNQPEVLKARANRMLLDELKSVVPASQKSRLPPMLRSPSQFQAAQPERVADDRYRRQAHRGRGDHRREQRVETG